MSQSKSFSNLSRELYFNVDIKHSSCDTVIAKFDKLAKEHTIQSGIRSLSTNLDMNSDSNAQKQIHIFKFNDSPIVELSFSSGQLKLEIGISDQVKKILNLEWLFLFNTQDKADSFFKKLQDIFLPVSTLNKIEEDKSGSLKSAQFSTRNINESGIKDVTFILNKSNTDGLYTIRILPYNEFIE